MNPSVPRGAALLLDFIGGIEAPLGYGVIYRNRQDLLSRPLTEMTLEEVLVAQQEWKRVNGSSACGRYQVMRMTLADMIGKMGLSQSRRFDADLQDLVGYALLRRRGYERFMAGDLPLADFALQLAKEWAALPVLAPTHGAHAMLEAGQSYYRGDGVNLALVGAAEFEATLRRCRALEEPSRPPTGPRSRYHRA